MPAKSSRKISEFLRKHRPEHPGMSNLPDQGFSKGGDRGAMTATKRHRALRRIEHLAAQQKYLALGKSRGKVRKLGFGGANGIRTRDPHTASVVRYQLRHSP